MENLTEFPKVLPWSHIMQKGDYALITSEINDKGVYAFYERTLGYGFKHAIEINSVNIADNPNTWDKPLIQIKTLASTCKMSKDAEDRYLIVREDYFYTLNDALGHLKGEQRVYKPKRKPELIRPLTEQQIKEHWSLK